MQEWVGTCTDDDLPDCPVLRMAVNLPEVFYERAKLRSFDAKDSALCF
jgi:hypothetical protein